MLMRNIKPLSCYICVLHMPYLVTKQIQYKEILGPFSEDSSFLGVRFSEFPLYQTAKINQVPVCSNVISLYQQILVFF